MDDNKVAILLEDLLSKFRTFGEGQDALRTEVHEIKQKVDGLIEDMDVVKPSVRGLIEDMGIVKPMLKSMDNRLTSLEGKVGSLEGKVDSLEGKVDSLEGKVDSLETKTNGLIEDMDIVKPALVKINNRLDNIEGEIIKLNPESRAALKQVR